MAYIGKSPTIGNFQKCDAITVVNGQAAYTMQVGGTNVSPESENHMLVSLNGILQAPVDSFTISGSTITFASNLATGDVIDFIMLLGNVLDLGVPSDNTVSTAKIVDNAVTNAKIGSDVPLGKVLQVVSATDNTQRSTTSGTYVTGSNTLTVDITPASTSNKILVMFSSNGRSATDSKESRYSIFRDSTNIGGANGIAYVNKNDATSISGVIVDSPSSTSQLTYQVYMKAESGFTMYLNHGNTLGTIIAMEIGV